MSHSLLIWGKGGHAEVVKDAAWPQCERIEQMDDNDPIEWLSEFGPKDWQVFVAIGDNRAREVVFNRLTAKGYRTPNIVAKSAIVARNAELKTNSGIFVAHGAIVQPRAKIDMGAIINTGATIDHDCKIGAFVHIAPGCHLCGGVEIRYRTLVGVGTSIIPNIYIEQDTIIGGGSAVIDDIIVRGGLFAGVPAQGKFKVKFNV